MSPFQGGMGYPPMSTNNMKSPLEGLFGKPKFAQEDIPQNMAEIIGTLSKMAIQVGFTCSSFISGGRTDRQTDIYNTVFVIAFLSCKYSFISVLQPHLIKAWLKQFQMD